MKLGQARRIDGLAGSLVVFLSCFALTFAVGSLILTPGYSDAATDTDVTMFVDVVISMSITNGAEALEIEPSATGVSASGDIVVNTSTNNSTGLTLTMAAADNASASIVDTALTHTNGTDNIPSTTNATYAALQNSTWGYSLESNTGNAIDTTSPVVNSTADTYLRIPGPTTPDTLLVTNAPTAGNSTTITAGAKVDMAKPAGTYTGKLLFTATANYVPPIPVQDDDAMQDLDNLLYGCPTYPTIARLIDQRDGHYYAVSKLADGKCWMLTNLAYGGVEAGTEFTTGAGQSDTSGDAVASSNTWTRQSPPFNNQKQWVNPTNSTDNGGMVTQYADTACTSDFRSALADIDYTECGYFYNWCAALGNASVACNQDGGTVADAGTGLCPAGWRLPTAREATSDLLIALGATTMEEGQGLLFGTSSIWRGVMSGSFYPGYGLADQAMWGTNLWTRNTASGASNSSALQSYDSNILVYDTERANGFAVRCVVMQDR